jgi:protein SCO1/2
MRKRVLPVLLLWLSLLGPGAFADGAAGAAAPGATNGPTRGNPLLEYKFINELGQPVSIADFRGDVVAVTFFFTRCPMPQFCPRLSKNFQEASGILRESGGAFTNWHFLSITFDPEFDTPETLRAYAQRYEYNAREWSFLTGPKDKIAELARLAGIKTDPDNGLINHNFRTLILDAEGRLRMVFPMGGNLTDSIVDEMRKAAKPPEVAKNRTAGASSRSNAGAR